MGRRVFPVWVLLLAAAGSACEVVDRVRNRGEVTETPGTTATAGALTLGLQAPGTLRPGEEGIVRLSLANRGESIPRGIRLELLVPGWLELAPPRPGDREVTVAASAEEGTRFSYRMDDPPVDPGQTQVVEQRIRIPLGGPVTRGATPWSRLIRARLVSADGEPLAEVESEIALAGVAPDSARVGPAETAGAQRDRLGAARLGMSAAALRQAVAGARDTSWMREGSQERGTVLPLQGGRALAVLSGDTVVRIEVRDTVVRTREGLGVGSRLEELRAAYGRACAGTGEGTLVVWFPSAPGISFALDAPLPGQPEQILRNPDRIPGTARVTRWWLRRGSEGCP